MLDIYCNKLDVFLTGLGGLGRRESSHFTDLSPQSDPDQPRAYRGEINRVLTKVNLK